jgi:hypothetical protein
MKIRNKNPLFSYVHSVTFDEKSAREFTKKSKASVKPGDELRTYVDKDGLPAQAIIARSAGEGAVAFSERDGFMWGTLLEAGDKAYLIGEGDPCVMIDLSTLAFWHQEDN